MDAIDQKIRAEFGRFRKMLPDLLAQHRGRWVVFLDGAVEKFYDDEDSAYADGVRRHGIDGGFVVAPIDEETGISADHSFVFSRVT